MYNPKLGCWLSRDPIETESGDPNLYRYVLNNPPNLIDPTGLQANAEIDPCDFILPALQVAARKYMIFEGMQFANSVLIIGGVARIGARANRFNDISRRWANRPPQELPDLGRAFLREVGEQAFARASKNLRNATFGTAIVAAFVASVAAENKDQAFQAYFRACEVAARCYSSRGGATGRIAFVNTLGREIMKCEWKPAGDCGGITVGVKKWGLKYALGFEEWEGP